jgi:hypothetical protein
VKVLPVISVKAALKDFQSYSSPLIRVPSTSNIMSICYAVLAEEKLNAGGLLSGQYQAVEAKRWFASAGPRELKKLAAVVLRASK